MANIFNNRELAAAIWGLIFVTGVLIKVPLGKQLKGVLVALLSKKILVPFVLMVAYVAGIVYVLGTIGLWSPALLKDALLWFFSVAIVMFFDLNKTQEDETFFRNAVLDSLKLVVILEFLGNMYTFPLWLELILVPVATIVVVTKAVADMDKRNAAASKVLETVAAIYGISVLVFSVYHVMTGWKDFAMSDNALAFVLPIILTVCLVPFVYLFALVAKYETMFMRLEFSIPDRTLLRQAKRGVVRRFHINLRGLLCWSQRVGTLHAASEEDVLALLRR